MKKTKIFAIFVTLFLSVTILYSCSTSKQEVAPKQVFEKKEYQAIGGYSLDKGPCTKLYLHYTTVTDLKGNVLGYKNCFTARSYCGEESFRWWGEESVNCSDYL